MKKIAAVFVVLYILIFYSLSIKAAPAVESDTEFVEACDYRGGIMLLVRYQSGSAIYSKGRVSAFNGHTTIIFITGIGILIALFSPFRLTNRNHKKFNARNKEKEYFDDLRKAFIDADDGLVYLKDENLKYVFINKATQEFYNKRAEDIIGRDDFSITGSEFALIRRQTDVEVLKKGTLIIDEVEWGNRIYKVTKFPAKMPNDRFGVGAYIKDITQERLLKEGQQKALHRHMTLIDVLNRDFQSRQEQLDYVLGKSLELTESKFGCIYVYDEKKQELTLGCNFGGGTEQCTNFNPQTKYQLKDAGIWGEAVRQRLPIVINDFQKSDSLKKDFFMEHAWMDRFMSVPVVIDQRIVAVVGLANKEGDYDGFDIFQMTVMMKGIWNAIERKEAQDKLSYEQNKYLQTLLSIGDGVMVVDRNGSIEVLNNVAQQLTGWSVDEALGRHYKEVFVLSHGEQGIAASDPIEDVLKTNSIRKLDNCAMLISKDGTKYYLEDIAAPIKNDTDATIGVVLVFRDVTEKRRQRKEIEHLSYRDPLTGLYNRRFFEEELRRLDTDRNLPISIIMGDINRLKLANDVFGHTYGDTLLERVAQVIGKICRTDDIVARWGGDEFVILLPKTGLEEAERIKTRIKNEFAKERIKSIRGSISMGCETKADSNDNIVEVLKKAEEKMYLAKVLEGDEIQSSSINGIITALHLSSAREREHAYRVSQLCQDLGKALKMPAVGIRRLKEAAFFHDIGKIVLEPRLRNKNHDLTHREWNEIRRHPIVGYRILNSFNSTMDLAQAVLSHHERWDGSGYPKGLKGKEIPKLSRIISIVGTYERMTNDSENVKAMDEEDALNILKKNAGMVFDPEITGIFVRMLEG